MLKSLANEGKESIRALGKLIFRFDDTINESIEFPTDYYETTSGLKPNLGKFEEALQEIRVKYAGNSEKGIRQMCDDEIDLAKCICHFRAGNYSIEMLEKAVELEGIYGLRRRARAMKRGAQEIADQLGLSRTGQTRVTESEARWEIMDQLMDDIVHNINPGGQKIEQQINWRETVDALEAQLQEKGLALKGLAYNSEIEKLVTGLRQSTVPQGLQEKLAEIERTSEQRESVQLDPVERGRE